MSRAEAARPRGLPAPRETLVDALEAPSDSHIRASVGAHFATTVTRTPSAPRLLAALQPALRRG